MNKLTVRDIPIKGRRVLMRADFNVPLKGTRITDATRIQESLPTIRYVLGEGGRAPQAALAVAGRERLRCAHT